MSKVLGRAREGTMKEKKTSKEKCNAGRMDGQSEREGKEKSPQ